MDEPFTITVDINRGLFRVVMRGLWTAETVSSYRHALEKVVGDALARGLPHAKMVGLVDARQFGAQTQEALNRFQDEFSDNRFVPRRLATLVSSALFKRQVERVGADNQRLFTDEGEAIAWLLSPDPAT